jgi:DNA-binding GntR family transcriptional regulator
MDALPRPGTAAQHALDQLRLAIAAGEYRPGRRLLQEAIADQLGTSLAPVREALRALEQEGQIEYRPRRGYYITELRLADLREIYALRRLLEEYAARAAVPELDEDAIDRITAAARECTVAARAGDVAAELAANRRFHFGILESAGSTHLMRLIRLLWDSTEAYRALYYNSPDERAITLHAHDAILDAVRRRAVDEVVSELDAHRARALQVLSALLADRAPGTFT